MELRLCLEWESDRAFRFDEKPQRDKKWTIFNLSCGNILISFLVAHKKRGKFAWHICWLDGISGMWQGDVCALACPACRKYFPLHFPQMKKEEWADQAESRSCGAKKNHSGRHFVSAIKVCV